MKAFAYFIDQNTLRYALVEKRQKGFAVLRSGSLMTTSKGLEVLSSIIRELEQEDQIVSFIRSKKCYHSYFSFPFTSLLKLQKALPFQLESIPGSKEERMDAVVLTAKTKSSRDVQVFSVSKQDIMDSINKSKEVNLIPDHLTEQSWCQCKFLRLHHIRDGFVLDTYLDDVSLTLIKNSSVLESLVLPIKNIATHLQRSVEFLSSKHQIEGKLPIYLFGVIPNLENVDLYPSYPYGTQIGAAIDALDEKSSPSLQFLSTIFTPKKQITRLRRLWMKNILALFLGSLMIVAAANILKIKESHQIEKAIKEALQEIKLQHIADEFDFRHFSNLKAALDEVDQRLTKEAPFYNQKNPPILVASFIDWLSKKYPVENGPLERIRYELIDYPSAISPKKPYKVEITLTLKQLNDVEALKEQVLKEWDKKIKNIEVKEFEGCYQIKFNVS